MLEYFSVAQRICLYLARISPQQTIDHLVYEVSLGLHEDYAAAAAESFYIAGADHTARARSAGFVRELRAGSGQHDAWLSLQAILLRYSAHHVIHPSFHYQIPAGASSARLDRVDSAGAFASVQRRQTGGRPAGPLEFSSLLAEPGPYPGGAVVAHDGALPWLAALFVSLYSSQLLLARPCHAWLFFL